MIMTILGWYSLIIMIMSLTLTANSAIEKENSTAAVIGILIYVPMIIFVGRVLWML